MVKVKIKGKGFIWETGNSILHAANKKRDNVGEEAAEQEEMSGILRTMICPMRWLNRMLGTSAMSSCTQCAIDTVREECDVSQQLAEVFFLSCIKD